MPMMILRWALPFLFFLFPMPVLAQMIILVLRNIAKRTSNTLDDDLVEVLARNFNVPPKEAKDESGGAK